MRKILQSRKRLRDLMRYIIQAHHEQGIELPVLKLQLLCYFVDTENYRRTFKSLTGSVYRAQKEGPRPDGFMKVLVGMLHRGEVTLTKVEKGHEADSTMPASAQADCEA